MNSTVTLFNSLVQDGIPSQGGFGLHNYFGGADIDSGGNVFTDPVFVNSASGDLGIECRQPGD